MGTDLVRDWYTEKKCPVCGRIIIVNNPDLWAYRLKLKGKHIRYVCSWHCIRAYEARKKKKTIPKKAREIWKLLDMGMIPADVARALELPPTTVIYWRDRRMEADE